MWTTVAPGFLVSVACELELRRISIAHGQLAKLYRIGGMLS